MAVASSTLSELTAATKREIGSERLDWAGQSDPRHAFRAGFGSQFLFSIFFAGFSLFWMASASGLWTAHSAAVSPLSMAFPLFGLPFVAMGVWMLAAPWRAARHARSTLYAVTESRLIEVTAKRSAMITRTIYPGTILSTTRTDNADGTGSLVLTLAERQTSGKTTSNRTISLLGIEDAVRVQTLLENARAAERQS